MGRQSPDLAAGGLFAFGGRKTHDGAAFASSLDVARVFGKRHDNVLSSIASLAQSAPRDLLTFKEISYSDGYGRQQRAVEMTRDGFTLLAMGFTGAKALQFKLAYIAKFNEMERGSALARVCVRGATYPEKSRAASTGRRVGDRPASSGQAQGPGFASGDPPPHGGQGG